MDLPVNTVEIGDQKLTCDDISSVCYSDSSAYACVKLSFICKDESVKLTTLIIALVVVSALGIIITIVLYIKL